MFYVYQQKSKPTWDGNPQILYLAEKSVVDLN